MKRRKLNFRTFYVNRDSYAQRPCKNIDQLYSYAKSCSNDLVNMKKVAKIESVTAISKFLRYVRYECYVIKRISGEEDLIKYKLGDPVILRKITKFALKRMDQFASEFVMNMGPENFEIIRLNKRFSMLVYRSAETNSLIRFIVRKHIPVLTGVKSIVDSSDQPDFKSYQMLANLFMAILVKRK